VHDHPTALADTTNDFRWAAAVTGFGMLLHDSPDRGTLTWPRVLALATGAVGPDREGYRHELVDLVKTAASLAP
jgi:Ca-activated chloride channel family protein